VNSCTIQPDMVADVDASAAPQPVKFSGNVNLVSAALKPWPKQLTDFFRLTVGLCSGFFLNMLFTICFLGEERLKFSRFFIIYIIGQSQK